MRMSVIIEIKTTVYINHSEKESVGIFSAYICQKIQIAGPVNKFHQAKIIANILAKLTRQKSKMPVIIVIRPIIIA